LLSIFMHRVSSMTSEKVIWNPSFRITFSPYLRWMGFFQLGRNRVGVMITGGSVDRIGSDLLLGHIHK
jgi:hypothetical protein